MYVYVCVSRCICANRLCLVPEEARRGCQIPRDYSYSCEPPCGCWKPKLKLLTTEAALQPLVLVSGDSISNSACSQGCPRTPDPPASTSWGLGFQRNKPFLSNSLPLPTLGRTLLWPHLAGEGQRLLVPPCAVWLLIPLNMPVVDRQKLI